jgi:ankyrin repeat protein
LPAIALAIVATIAAPVFAQTPPPTPLAGVPQVPKTLPLFGTQSVGSVATAAAADKIDDVTLFLAEHASPDAPDENGRTALIYSAINNNPDIAQILLTRGAQIDLRDRLGKTALHWAAERGSLDVMRVLLTAKASVDSQSAQGLTPLMLAASNGHTAAVRLLMQYHADPAKEDYTGRDASDWAANNPVIRDTLKPVATH